MKFKKYSEYPPEIKRHIIIRNIIVNLFAIIPVIAAVLSLCGLKAASDIVIGIYLIMISAAVIALGIFLTVRAFRQKCIAAGIFLAFMSMTIPTVILLAATEKGRALVLYILEGY